jgi:hypothetical protein
MILRAMDLNPLMPHYYSELFVISFQLFDPGSEEFEQLQLMIQAIEQMVLDDNQLSAGMSLYDVEMAIESNPDYYAFFEKADGTTVTKFDIERELSKIKSWIYGKVRERAVGRKFVKYK